MRSLQLNIRMSETESERFNRVAAIHEMSVAQLVRFLLKAEAERLGVSIAPAQGQPRR